MTGGRGLRAAMFITEVCPRFQPWSPYLSR
jgi:hypothetical protein